MKHENFIERLQAVVLRQNGNNVAVLMRTRTRTDTLNNPRNAINNVRLCHNVTRHNWHLTRSK